MVKKWLNCHWPVCDFAHNPVGTLRVRDLRDVKLLFDNESLSPKVRRHYPTLFGSDAARLY